MSLLLRGGRVIDPANTMDAVHDVLIEAGKIARLGPRLQAPAGAEIIDVAGKIGIPGHDNDFGITLGKGGAAEGSYLVLPFVGPKPPRDLLGTGIDIAFDPLTYMTWNNSSLYMVIRGGLGVLDSRASNIDSVAAIERSSIDFYATSRSLYRQNRNAQIKGESANQDLPNF